MTPNPLHLKKYILEVLRASGPITFERYMALCLYHAEFGYYTQGRERTGMGGDYFTSPDLHPIFARLVARQAAEMWELLDRPSRFTWIDMGAGRGLFAHDFLSWMKRASPDLVSALDYVVVEPGEKQRARVRERLVQSGLETAIHLAPNLQEIEPISGCFFSNELLDAFPVAVVTRAGGHLKEIYVTADGDEFCEKLGPISNPAIAAAVARYAKNLEEGHRVEMNVQALQWMRSVAEKLARGFVMTIDYGDLAERLYTPDRPRGTLLAYRGHMSSEDFLSAPGECDLTAHVNFSALMDAGRDSGLELTGFTTQEKLLMALGEENQFADLYDPEQDEVEKLKARLKLKRLISPAGMGNVFKVLIQHHGIPAPKLTGLKYSQS